MFTAIMLFGVLMMRFFHQEKRSFVVGCRRIPWIIYELHGFEVKPNKFHLKTNFCRSVCQANLRVYLYLLWLLCQANLRVYLSLFGGCSIVGKPLCYHASNTGSVPREGRTNRSPYLLTLLGQLSLPSFRGW